MDWEILKKQLNLNKRQPKRTPKPEPEPTLEPVGTKVEAGTGIKPGTKIGNDLHRRPTLPDPESGKELRSQIEKLRRDLINQHQSRINEALIAFFDITPEMTEDQIVNLIKGWTLLHVQSKDLKSGLEKIFLVRDDKSQFFAYVDIKGTQAKKYHWIPVDQEKVFSPEKVDVSMDDYYRQFNNRLSN